MFRPGGKNRSLLVRPMQESCLVAPSGRAASMNLIRFFKKNLLERDGRYYMTKNQGAPIKWHEPRWRRRKREKREKLTKEWDRQVNNTCEMALWWRYRVEAKNGTYGNKVYNEYLEYEKSKKEENLIEMRKNKYKAWDMNDNYIAHKLKQRMKTPQEKEYQESLLPESKLQSLRNEFDKKVKLNESAFHQWKHDTSHLSFDYNDTVNYLIDPNYAMSNTSKHQFMLQQSNIHDNTRDNNHGLTSNAQVEVETFLKLNQSPKNSPHVTIGQKI